jgi:hypothetical protein
MKVGIITWHDIVNYGAVLQGYATQRILESWGHEAFFLKFKRTKGTDIDIKKTSLASQLYAILRNQTPNRILNRRGYAKQAQVFGKFRDDFFKIGGMDNEEKGLDAVVIGSDQIFDLKNGYNAFQYGKGVQCDRIVAYAPSFGETMIDDVEKSGHQEELTALLCRMKGLSARDQNTQEIIHTLTGKKPDIVVDSALLYGFKKEVAEWNNMKPVAKPYLVVYMIMGVTTDTAYCEAVKTFAKRHGLLTVSIGERRGWCDLSYPWASPQEFFQLIQQSQVVITNTFHGTIFSMLLNKPFYASYRGYNTNKLYHLLSYFNLTAAIKNQAQDLLTADLPNIDFIAMNETLEERRQHSIDYLKNALAN